ncbi:Zinc finger FYVE domain-containing protein 26 [Trifolium repens]|nr:Zinc finger FYVE domain-containing protein 26 [Trifolium repens]
MTQRLRLLSRKDRISSLPDSVLYHILSFLPTKDSAATSVLSKRWKPLWFSQLHLHFDDNDKQFPDAFAFRQFLYSVITLRDNTLPILSLHLNCLHHGFYYEIDFSNVLYAAITRGVQNLTVDVRHHHHGIMSLPTFVLTTKTLSVLKLKRVKLTLNENVVVDLPSLKLLHLKYVYFTYSQYIIRLLSGCPILEEFKAKQLILKKFLRLNHSLPIGRDVLSLSNLVRANVSSARIELDWLHNAHHLRIQPSRTYRLDRMFHNLTCMEVTFKFVPYLRGLSKWNWMTKLLQNSPKLQTLIIDDIDVRHCPLSFSLF